MTQHIVNISGGKDSAACYMLAIMRGKPFRAVTADTGHEHPITYDWIKNLHTRTGGPKVETVRADFSRKIGNKRSVVNTKWVLDGVDEKVIEAALEVLHPTGDPFLDLCIWKGRFPSRRAQFCTEWLKAEPIDKQVFTPAREDGIVVSWQGERRDESLTRADLPRMQRLRTPDLHDKLTFRPILHWSAMNTFELHKHFGLEPNLLYRRGMGRVGCFPCINAAKGELNAIFTKFPEVIEKLRRYEAIVSSSSKRGQATFFAAQTTPQGAQLAKDQKLKKRMDERFPSIDDIRDWSKTARGGRQFDGLALMQDEGLSCTSQYGLCE